LSIITNEKVLCFIGYATSLLNRGNRLDKSIQPRNILLIRTHALGDVLLTTPAIRAVRLRFRNSVLSMLTSEGTKPAIENNPSLDHVISFPDSLLVKRNPLSLWRLAGKLRREEYDCVISFSRSSLVHFVAMLTGSHLCVGLDCEGSGFPLTLKVPDRKSNVADTEQYAVKDYLDIVAALGVKSDGEQMDFCLVPRGDDHVSEFLNKVGITGDDLLIGIFPGGGQNSAETILSKRWQVTNYADLADRLIRELGAKVIVLGGPQDNEVVLQMLRVMENEAANACNIGNLNTFGHLLKRCAVLVTNDSLPLHLALSLKTPTVALFGPTNARALTPRSCERLVAIQSKLECSPCYWKDRYPGCKEYHIPRCMNAISVQEVLSTTSSMLERHGRL